MVVGVHAGDIESRAGGILAKYIAAGYEGHYVLMTNSNSGLYITKDGKEAYRYSEDMVKIRREQAEKSASIFGLKPVFLDFKEWIYTLRDGKHVYPDVKDMDFGMEEPSGREPIATATEPDDPKIQYGPSKSGQTLTELFLRIQPEIAIIQETDLTCDHQAAFNRLRSAFMNAAGKEKLGSLMVSTMYPVPVKSMQRKANIHFDVSDYMDVCLEAVKCFSSPLSKCAGTVESNRAVRKKAAKEKGGRLAGESFFIVNTGKDAQK